MLVHPQHEEILKTVLKLRQQGLSIPRICHQLAREYRSPSSFSTVRRVVGWESDHVIYCLQELREKGLLGEEGIKKYLDKNKGYYNNKSR